jgi:hypothetical protein
MKLRQGELIQEQSKYHIKYLYLYTQLYIHRSFKTIVVFGLEYAAYFVLLFSRHRLHTCAYVLLPISIVLLAYGFARDAEEKKRPLPQQQSSTRTAPVAAQQQSSGKQKTE